MRILHIISACDELGPGRQIQLLCSELPGDEFDAQVLVVGGPQPTGGPSAVGPLRLSASRGWHWASPRIPGEFVWRLVGLLRRVRPAIVHVWSQPLQAAACVAAQANGLPTIASQRWQVDAPVPSWTARLSQRGCGQVARRVVVDCEAARRQRLQQGLPADKLHVIRPGIPVPAVSERSVPSRADLLQALQLPADSRLLAIAAPFEHQQRLKDAIWAADLLKIVRSDCHLFVLGDGPLNWRLRRFRSQVRIADRVHFGGGGEEFWRLLPHLDIVWCTAEDGSLNASMLEAMAQGVPVIASDIVPHRAVLDHGATGLLFRTGHRAGLARCTLKLLEDEQLRGRLADAAQARLAHSFPVEAAVSAHVALYREIAA